MTSLVCTCGCALPDHVAGVCLRCGKCDGFQEHMPEPPTEPSAGLDMAALAKTFADAYVQSLKAAEAPLPPPAPILGPVAVAGELPGAQDREMTRKRLTREIFMRAVAASIWELHTHGVRYESSTLQQLMDLAKGAAGVIEDAGLLE